MGLSNYILLKDTRNPILRASVGNSLQLWLDANDSATITESSGSVSQWDDKSGNENHVVQGFGSFQPSFQTNIQNGKSVVDFDGGDFLVADSFSTFDSSGQTVFVVGQTRSTGFQIYVAKFFSGGTGTFFVAQSDDAMTYATNGGSGRVDDATIGQWAVNDTQIITCVFDNSFLSTHRNSILLSGSVVQTAPLQTNALDVTIGGTSAGSLKLTGFVAEVLIYNRKLSTAEITAINRYLATKWAIGISAPDNIGGLQLWLDANDSSTITESGDKVSQWDDKSGNGNDVTQGTESAQPTTNATARNGKNVIDWDGGDSFDLPSGLFSIPNGNNTIFIVAKRSTETGFTEFLINMQDGASGVFTFAFLSTAGSLAFRNGPGPTLIKSGATNTNFQIIRARRTGTTQALAFNGTTEETNTAGVDEAGVDAATIGNTPTALALIGSIAEIIIYDRSLATSEIQSVETYLSNKYGITLA